MSEQAAELLSAVQAEAQLDANQTSDLDLAERDEAQLDEPTDVTEASEPEQQAAASKPEADEDAEFEITLDDGADPVPVKLADLADAYKRWKGVETQVQDVVRTVETQAMQRRAQELQLFSQKLSQNLQAIDVFTASLPRPQEPDQELLNQNSNRYNPEEYLRQQAHFQRVTGFMGQLQQQQQAAQQQLQQAQAAQDWERAGAELQQLTRVWPEWGDPVTAEKLADDMSAQLAKHYRLDRQTLESVSDHRFFLMAKDALAYRAQAKGAEVKQIVAAKREPPRATRGQTQTRDQGGRYVASAQQALANGPYTPAKGQAFFAALIKQGAIK